MLEIQIGEFYIHGFVPKGLFFFDFDPSLLATIFVHTDIPLTLVPSAGIFPPFAFNFDFYLGIILKCIKLPNLAVHFQLEVLQIFEVDVIIIEIVLTILLPRGVSDL